MANWRNFYLQKVGTDSSSNPYPTYESVKEWGVWCKDIPFKLFDKVKEPAKRTWHDEHGDDEYISSDGLMLEAYTMDVEFGCKIMKATTDGSDSIPAVNDVRANVAAFLEYLRSTGMMMIYSDYTRIGRTDVRLESVGSDAHWKKEKKLTYTVEKVQTAVNEEYLVFKVTFKVNDPKTDIVYHNGHLVQATTIKLFKWSQTTPNTPTVTASQWGTQEPYDEWYKQAQSRPSGDGYALYMSQNKLIGSDTIISTAWSTPIQIA